MLTKFCPLNGCNTIIPIGQRYCDKHTEVAEAREAQRQAYYDKRVRFTRDKQYHSFYKSKEWERIKRYIHNRYHGLCLYSLMVNNKVMQADAVHHIEPLREAWGKRLDIGNLIPLAGSMHGMIESEYTHGDKSGMQKLLWKLLERWDAEYGEVER
jgi:5-methylcytosine-specific restriction protein A